MAQFANTADVGAFSMENTIAGFNKTGIHPFNRNTFTKDDFVTDRPIPELHTELSTDNTCSTSTEIPSTVSASTMSVGMSSSSSPQITSLESNKSINNCFIS